MNSYDRRVRKTKNAIKEALAELVLETDLRNITIRELTDKADVHRATFYAHYKDIYDLLEKIEESVIKELSTIIVSDPNHTYEGSVNLVIEYVYNNAKIARMLLNNNVPHSFYDRISRFLENQYLEIWKYEAKQDKVNEEIRFQIKYHIQGFLSVVRRWVETNLTYPREELVNIINKLDNNFDTIMY